MEIKSDEWFEEYCWLCGNIKLVHNDMETNLSNPGFICKDCEDMRRETSRMMLRSVSQ